MTIEVAAPIVEFLSMDRTTAGVKATGTITYLTGGTDTDTLVVSDSKKAITFEILDDVTDPTDAAYYPIAVADTTWELKEAIEPILGAAFDLVVTDANVGAESTVVFDTGAPTDGAIVIVTDALENEISFEFTTAGDGETGDVQVVKGADHEASAEAFTTAVNAAFEGLGPDGEDTIVAVESPAGTVTLTGHSRFGLETMVASDPSNPDTDGNITCAVWGNGGLDDGLTKSNLEATFKGTSGNETITEGGNTFTVTGMASGTNAVLTIGMNDTVGTPEFTLTRYNDGSILFTDAQGNVVNAHSDNYLVARLYDALKAIVAA